MEKEAMNKESKEPYMGEFGGRKGNDVILLQSQKNKGSKEVVLKKLLGG